MYPDFAAAATESLDQHSTCFLQGPAGSGKSQALLARLHFLLREGIPGYSILVILPDRTAALRYRTAVSRLDLGPYGAVDLQTYYGLASRLVRLFWPLVAAGAGFAAPQRPPVYLNYETAQYVMGQVIAPLLAQGYFEGLAMRPQRVLSQLLDDLNKAAVNGYPLGQVQERLVTAWTGDEGRLRNYAQVQECIELFRKHCLQYNLLDASLVVEVFHQHLVEKEAFWRYFTERFRHLLMDDVEESVPVAQDLVLRLLSGCDSALLTGDEGGGFRIFLGVDPEGSIRLRQACGKVVTADLVQTCPPDMTALCARLGRRLGQEEKGSPAGDPRRAVAGLIQTRYRNQMIDAVAAEIAGLVNRGVAPGEMAVVAPHADGVLRFMLAEAFRASDIPFAVVRRYEMLREEPVVRACLVLAALAHPEWGMRLSLFDIQEALGVALAPLDPLRAALAARHLYDPRKGTLRAGETLAPAVLERIGTVPMERFEALREWIFGYRGGAAIPFDHFLRRLFGEVLSGPGVGPEDAAVYSKLIASAVAFREVAPAMGLDGKAIGQRYVEMIYSGVVAAQYLTDLDVDAAPESIALVAPTYTYLLSGHVARFQFWLDVGSMVWWEQLHQPLTHHYVLRRSWTVGERWGDVADFQVRNLILFRLVRGLILRCREGIYLCTSEREGRGEPQDSPLLLAVQQVLREEP